MIEGNYITFFSGLKKLVLIFPVGEKKSGLGIRYTEGGEYLSDCYSVHHSQKMKKTLAGGESEGCGERQKGGFDIH